MATQKKERTKALELTFYKSFCCRFDLQFLLVFLRVFIISFLLRFCADNLLQNIFWHLFICVLHSDSFLFAGRFFFFSCALESHKYFPSTKHWSSFQVQSTLRMRNKSQFRDTKIGKKLQERVEWHRIFIVWRILLDCWIAIPQGIWSCYTFNNSIICYHYCSNSD